MTVPDAPPPGHLQPAPEPQPVSPFSGDPGLEADVPSFEAGGPAHRVDSSRRHTFHPRRLPDARGPRVPDRVRLELPVLLAARLGEIRGIVFCADRYLAGRLDRHEVGQVHHERRVAPLVRTGQGAVDPYRGGVIDGPEMEQQAFAVAQWRDSGDPPVPAGLVEAGIVDAASRRFRRERDHDRAIPVDVTRTRITAGMVEREIPLAVQ